ncbi:hypothetical protein [Streptomyces sp. C184]|uniref:hypothetical protein n=1 Tax=Streptomyces sp. C184 TaxID=3237121 RepID=UPI0034C64868
MDLLERLADVRRRPRAYGLTTFGEVAAFVTGMDAATEWKFLDGFRLFLAAKSNVGPSLAWQVLVIRMAYPAEADEFWVTASRSESSEATSVLFDELQSFFAERENSGTN